jgi:hypothetical protein
MHLRDYLRKDILITPPPSCDYTTPARASLDRVYMNDQYGDCVIAAGYHILGVETGNANGGDPLVVTDEQIVADYSAIGGFDPKNPLATDNGCDEQTAFNYWTQHGFADGSKLCGWLALDATNTTQVQTALFLFENLFFGIELPDAWITPFPSSAGFMWDDGAPNPMNGHAVPGVGYDSKGVQIDTWGLVGTITWAAIAHLCSSSAGGELYVLLSPDQVAKGQTKAPNGFLWTDLQADFAALGGNPGPTPPPSPTPPGPTPTDTRLGLADVQTILTQNWPTSS